jgi:hypothetical protein
MDRVNNPELSVWSDDSERVPSGSMLSTIRVWDKRVMPSDIITLVSPVLSTSLATFLNIVTVNMSVVA